MNFTEIPTKTVTLTDHETLLQTLRQGPKLFDPQDYPTLKATNTYALLKKIGKLAFKTCHILEKDQITDAIQVTFLEGAVPTHYKKTKGDPK